MLLVPTGALRCTEIARLWRFAKGGIPIPVAKFPSHQRWTAASNQFTDPPIHARSNRIGPVASLPSTGRVPPVPAPLGGGVHCEGLRRKRTLRLAECHGTLSLLPELGGANNLADDDDDDLPSPKGRPVRSIATQKLGYFPLPPTEAERIRHFLVFPSEETSALDPCAGTGLALACLTSGAKATRCAVELDAFRAEEAAKTLDRVVQANCFDVHCAVDSFSLVFLNPPYSGEISESRNARMERLFLECTYRWLKPGGVLVLVIQGNRLSECVDVLATHFRDKAIYRLSAPESIRYNQIVTFGVRRTRREREQLKDWEVQRAKTKLMGFARNYDELTELPSQADRQFAVPAGGAPQLIHRGLPLDALEDVLPASVAYRRAGRILFAPEVRATGRPLSPLHGGHVALLTTSGLINGIFGEGPDLHVARWESVKVTDRFEETDEDDVTTIRERERFTQCLTLVYADGATAILQEGDRQP
jgi:predicted RNA methylase